MPELDMYYRPQMRMTDNCWHLSVNLRDQSTVDLQIKHAFNGDTAEGYRDTCASDEWNRYKTVVFTVEENPYEVVSDEEWDSRHAEIIQDQGHDVAQDWVAANKVRCQKFHGSDDEPIWEWVRIGEELKQRWQGMLMSGIFNPAINNGMRWDY